MTRIGIICTANIKHMTLISKYTEILEKNRVSYDFIYIDRYDIKENNNANNIFRFVQKNYEKNKFQKLISFLKFKKFAIEIINTNKYDYLIVWNEKTILLFSDFLINKYKNRYFLNIRDYFLNKNYFVQIIYKYSIKNSAFTTISSNGFKRVLPDNLNLINLHSYNNDLLKGLVPREFKAENSSPINLTFVGNVRFLDLNKKLLSVFKNDSRFKINFFGTNANQLNEYAKKNKIINTEFHDSFDPQETVNYISKTDVVNNLYGNTNSTRYLTSIKLFHGLHYRTPIIVNGGTYMAEIVSKYNLGLVIDEIDENLPDILYDYYENMDYEEFKNTCKTLLERINNENYIFEESFEKYLLGYMREDKSE